MQKIKLNYFLAFFCLVIFSIQAQTPTYYEIYQYGRREWNGNGNYDFKMGFLAPPGGKVFSINPGPFATHNTIQVYYDYTQSDVFKIILNGEERVGYDVDYTFHPRWDLPYVYKDLNYAGSSFPKISEFTFNPLESEYTFIIREDNSALITQNIVFNHDALPPTVSGYSGGITTVELGDQREIIFRDNSGIKSFTLTLELLVPADIHGNAKLELENAGFTNEYTIPVNGRNMDSWKKIIDPPPGFFKGPSNENISLLRGIFNQHSSGVFSNMGIFEEIYVDLSVFECISEYYPIGDHWPIEEYFQLDVYDVLNKSASAQFRTWDTIGPAITQTKNITAIEKPFGFAGWAYELFEFSDESSLGTFSASVPGTTDGKLTEGDNTVVITRADIYGNTSTWEGNVILDTLQPSIDTWPFENNEIINQDSFNFSWNNTNGPSGLRISDDNLDSDPSVSYIKLVDSRGNTFDYEFSGDDKVGTINLPDDGTYTLTIQVTDRAGNTTGEVSRSFTVDTVGPTLIIPGWDDVNKPIYFNQTSLNFAEDVSDVNSGNVADGEYGWFNQEKLLLIYMADSVTSLDSSDLRITYIQEGVTQNVSDTFPSSITSTRFTFSVSDEAGNETTVNRYLGFEDNYPYVDIDDSQPYIFTIGEMSWTSGNIPVITTDHPTVPSGLFRRMYQNNGGWLNLNGPFSFGGGPSGESKTIQVKVQDNAGNLTLRNLDLALDNTPPNIEIHDATKIGAIYYVNGDDITFVVSDPHSGINSVSLTDGNDQPIDSTINENTENSWQIKIPTEGMNENVESVFKLLATDRVGNTTAELSFTVELDKTEPIVSDPSPDWTTRDDISINISDSTGLESISYQWEGGTPQKVYTRESGNRTTYVLTALTQGLPGTTLSGEYDLTITAIDRLGQGRSVTKTLWIDEAPPQIDAVDVSAFQGTDEYRFTVTDDPGSGIKSIVYFINQDPEVDNSGGVTQTFSGELDASHEMDITLPEGKNTVYIQAKDGINNVSAWKEVKVWVDTAGPSISMVSDPSLGFWYNTSALQFDIADGGSGLSSSVPARYSLDSGANWTDLNLLDGRATIQMGQGSRNIRIEAQDDLGNSTLLDFLDLNIDSIAPITSIGLSDENTYFIEGDDGDDLVDALGFSSAPVISDLSDTDALSDVDLSDYTVAFELVDKDGTPADAAHLNYQSYNEFMANDWANLFEGRGLGEGTHQLYIHLIDQAGNQADSAVANIYVDGTHPVLDRLVVSALDEGGVEQSVPPAENRANEFHVDYDNFLFNNLFYLDETPYTPLIMLSHQQLTDVELEDPGLWTDAEWDETWAYDFPDEARTVFLYTKAVDSVGLTSPVEEYVFRLDNFGPNLTLNNEESNIPSATTIQDAVSLDDGEIHFEVTSNNLNASGIRSVSWTLVTGDLDGNGDFTPWTDYASGQISNEGDAYNTDFLVSFEGLPSNENTEDDWEGDFFRFRAVATGENELESQVPFEHYFRIDTSPPTDLSAKSRSYPSTTKYFHRADFNAYWGEPADAAGIAQVQYRITQKDDNGLDEIILTASQDSPDGWITAILQDADNDLSPVDFYFVTADLRRSDGWGADPDNSPLRMLGEIEVAIKSMDTLGNTKEANTTSFLYDFSRPSIAHHSFATYSNGGFDIAVDGSKIFDNLLLDVPAITIQDYSVSISAQTNHTPGLFLDENGIAYDQIALTTEPVSLTYNEGWFTGRFEFEAPPLWGRGAGFLPGGDGYPAVGALLKLIITDPAGNVMGADEVISGHGNAQFYDSSTDESSMYTPLDPDLPDGLLTNGPRFVGALEIDSYLPQMIFPFQRRVGEFELSGSVVVEQGQDRKFQDLIMMVPDDFAIQELAALSPISLYSVNGDSDVDQVSSQFAGDQWLDLSFEQEFDFEVYGFQWQSSELDNNPSRFTLHSDGKWSLSEPNFQDSDDVLGVFQWPMIHFSGSKSPIYSESISTPLVFGPGSSNLFHPIVQPPEDPFDVEYPDENLVAGEDWKDWDLQGTIRLEARGNQVFLNGAEINSEASIVPFEWNMGEEAFPNISMTQPLQIRGDSAILGGGLDITNLTLEVGANTFLLESAKIDGATISIDRAKWLLPVSDPPDSKDPIIQKITYDDNNNEVSRERVYEILLEGFKLTVDGRLLRREDFNAPDHLVLWNNGFEILFGDQEAQWSFDDNRIVFNTSQVRGSALASWAIDGLSLTSESVDFSTAVTSQFVEMNLKGFELKGIANSEVGIGQISPGCIAFDQVYLEIPRNLTDGVNPASILLNGLEVDSFTLEILNPGRNLDQVIALRREDLMVNASDFHFDEDLGLWASGVVPLPTSVNNRSFFELENLNFDRIQILSLTSEPNGPDIRSLPRETSQNSSNAHHTPISMSIHGIPFELTGISMSQGTVQVDSAKATLPGIWDNPTAEFNHIAIRNRLDAHGAYITSPHTFLQDRIYARDDWNFYLASLSLGDEGLFGEGHFHVPYNLGGNGISVEGLEILSDGNYELGPQLGTLAIEIQDWIFITNRYEIVGNEVVMDTPKWWLPSLFTNDEIKLSSITFNNQGQITDHGSFTQSGIFKTRNGFEVDLMDIALDENKITFGGDLRDPTTLDQSNAEPISFPSGSLRLLSQGYLQSAPLTESRQFPISGWSVTGNGVQLTRNGLVMESIEVAPSNGIGPFTLPGLTLDWEGKILESSILVVPFSLELVEGLGASVRHVSFDEDGLGLRAHVELPDVIGVKEIYFEKIVIMPNGSVWSNTLIPVVENYFEELGLGFRFTNVRFQRDGFSIQEAEIQLPEVMENEILRINDFKVGFDGSFEIGQMDFQPLELWGYEFRLTGLSAGQGKFGLNGAVQFPQDFFIPSLAGASLDIKKLELDLTTDEPSVDFEVVLDSEIVFVVFDNWTVIVDTVSVTTEAFTVDSGSIQLPPEYGVDQVSVAGLSIDMKTGEVTIGDISLEGIDPIQFAGLEFIVDEATLSQTDGFVFGGTLTIPEENTLGYTYPEILQGSTLEVSKFQIRPDFSIGDVRATLSGLTGTLFTEDLLLLGGELSLDKTDEDLIFGIAGGVYLMTGFPEGLAGKTLLIKDFQINAYTGEILALNAGLGLGEDEEPLYFDLFGAIRVEASKIWFGTSTTTDGYELGVNGALVMGDSFPEELQGEKVNIDSFILDTEGGIIDFAASFSPEEDLTLLDGLDWKSPYISVEQIDQSDLEFSVSGELFFGSTFPEGIAGSKLVIADFRFNSEGEIYDGMDVYYQIPNETSLFGLLEFNETTITLAKDQEGFFAGLSGNVVLPETLPEGFAGLEININEFEFYTHGEIKSLDMGFDSLNLDIFGVASLENVGMNVREDSDIFIFDVSGILVMPEFLPGDLSSARVRVESCSFSSDGDLLSFDAAFTAPIGFDLFAGISTRFDLIALSDEGIRLAGSLNLPDSLPTGFPSSVQLDNLEMSWSGDINAIAAGIDSLDIDLFGLRTQITNISVDKDHMNIESGIITLPEALNSQTITMTNAGINFEGGFYGELGSDDIEMEFAGFFIAFVRPSMDFESGILTFDLVSAQLPAALGGLSTELVGVSISSSGIDFGGGEFRLPDFTVGGGLGFRNIYVSFEKDGHDFQIEGGGEALLPDGSALSAEVKFTNISDTYPIGLKKAQFTYKISGAGIPIGASGVYLNEISGGIAYGPPEEVPDALRWVFDEQGMRLNLSITMSAGNPELLRGRVSAWMDLWNFALALRGELIALDGMATAMAEAAVSNNGLYLGMTVKISIVEGAAQVWVFEHENRTLVNGIASVKITIPAWEFIVGPWTKTTFGGISVSFGRFTNNKTGVYGEIQAGDLGSFGTFVSSSGSLEVFVDGFEVILPEGAHVYE